MNIQKIYEFINRNGVKLVILLSVGIAVEIAIILLLKL